MNIVYEVGGEPVEELNDTTDNIVADGRYHSLLMTRDNNNVTLIVDGNIIQDATSLLIKFIVLI